MRPSFDFSRLPHGRSQFVRSASTRAKASPSILTRPRPGVLQEEEDLSEYLGGGGSPAGVATPPKAATKTWCATDCFGRASQPSIHALAAKAKSTTTGFTFAMPLTQTKISPAGVTSSAPTASTFQDLTPPNSASPKPKKLRRPKARNTNSMLTPVQMSCMLSPPSSGTKRSSPSAETTSPEAVDAEECLYKADILIGRLRYFDAEEWLLKVPKSNGQYYEARRRLIKLRKAALKEKENINQDHEDFDMIIADSPTLHDAIEILSGMYLAHLTRAMLTLLLKLSGDLIFSTINR